MIFVDSGFWLAFAQPTDALHRRAVAWARSLSEPLRTTEYALFETVNSLSRRADRPRAHRIVEMIWEDPNYIVVPASPELFAAGLQLHRDRPDKEWSLTDCVSFHLMRERGLSPAPWPTTSTLSRRVLKRCSVATRHHDAVAGNAGSNLVCPPATPLTASAPGDNRRLTFVIAGPPHSVRNFKTCNSSFHWSRKWLPW